MSEWKTPQFDEIRMDAEINCYSSAIEQKGIPLKPAAVEADLAESDRKSSPS